MTDCANCPKTGFRSRWVAPQRSSLLSGILNVDKPADMTSHDVVDAVRRMAGQRKVGHAGTLDPMATGVLLVCLGNATRVAEFLMAGRKRYRATIVLGTTTETYDAQGTIVTTGGRIDFGRKEIEEALSHFVGPIRQVPPIYSAIKHQGQPLYKLARRGEEVQVAPRPVEIDEISLLDWEPSSLIIEVSCSPGTYIRSLAHDLGQRLGCGAYLAALVRLQSGHFSLAEAVSLHRLEEAFEHGQEGDYLFSLDEALLDLPAVILGQEDARRVVHGQATRIAQAVANSQEPSAYQGSHQPVGDEGRLCRAYSAQGDFLAILSYQPDSDHWRPKKVFAST